jgi:arsenate reductase
MAEGFLRHLAGDRFDVVSAGTEPGEVNPLAVEVMCEVGIDISGHRSKPVAGFLGESFKYLIRVCDHEREKCPIFPGAVKRVDWPTEDPAAAQGSAADRLGVFRSIRDEIGERVRRFVAEEVRRRW